MKISESDISVIDLDSELYPQQLKALKIKAKKLFYYGSIENLEVENNISIVGTRKASSYGKYLTEKLVEFLSHYQINIISGLAVGIDSTAHEAAIKSSSRTIAVIGSGLLALENYQRTQKETISKISGNPENLILSEFEPLVNANKWTFPARNRIIAALSQATIVIEASEGSGSLITAHDAIKLGRAVFSFPGETWKESFRGSNKLLQEGLAIPLYEPSDIVKYLNLQKKNTNTVETQPLNLSEQEKNILDNLKLEPISFDELLGTTKGSHSEVLTQLSLLELKGFVKKYPGARFAKQS